MPEHCAFFLDRKRKAATRAWKSYPSLDALVERRGSQNPRLAALDEWLRYFVYHAARESDDGWHWKADPHIASGGFGPFRAAWVGPDWIHLKATTADAYVQAMGLRQGQPKNSPAWPRHSSAPPGEAE